ncbi:hypothetical protein FY143_17800 [Agrobacterium tumefaciens]|nr:hypothetical protein FY143_17800 [Agrobacterium tumefaciens]
MGAQVLDWSRAQVALMRPSRSTRALEAIIRDLIETRDGATYFAERVCGISLRYELGENHPLVGCSVPDFELADGSRTGELLRKGKGLLLNFSVDASLEALAGRWNGRIFYVVGNAIDQLGLSTVLVRPDGIVACATESTPDKEKFARATALWFGEI